MTFGQTNAIIGIGSLAVMGVFMALGQKISSKVAKVYNSLTDTQLSPHFSWNEFAGNIGLSMDKADPRTIQMAKGLANTLEVIRSAVGKPITISNGIRNEKYYRDMLARGTSNPSPTSDHFYQEAKNVNPLGSGAADITCNSLAANNELATKALFNKILELKYSGKIKTGQVLIEKANSWWVHLANDPREFLTPAELAKRSDNSLNKIAVSTNNGSSFTDLKYGSYYA